MLIRTLGGCRLLLLAFLGLVTVGCNEIPDPVTSAEDGLAATGAVARGEDHEGAVREGGNAKPQEVVDTLSISASENQRSVILKWQDDAGLDYALVRAENIDCNPLNMANCKAYLRMPMLLGGLYIDENIQQGAVYYYWLIAEKTDKDNDGSVTATVEAEEEDERIATSKTRRIALPVLDDMDAYIPEQPAAIFPQDLVLTREHDMVELRWSYSAKFTVNLYAGADAECNLAKVVKHKHSENQDTASNCAKLVGASSTTPLRVDANEMNGDYLWVVIANALVNGNINSNTHRVIGPYKLPDYSVFETRKQLQLVEQATSNQHNLEIRFKQSNLFLVEDAVYTLVAINSFMPLDFNEVETRLQTLRDDNPGKMLTAKDIIVNLGNFGNVQTKLLRTHNFVRGDDHFSYRIGVTPGYWYTVFISVSNGINTQTYLPMAVRTANRFSVEVTGEYGLWRVKHNDKVELALRTSGHYFPGLLDWRSISIDAKMALPGKHTYYFSGCPYYGDKLGETDNVSLSNNICRFAEKDENGGFVTPFTSPIDVRITFEHKATSTACSEYTRIENTRYERSRFVTPDNHQNLLCDYRNITPGTEQQPNYYTFVNPNHAPVGIAHGKVGMWRAGTQAPIFLKGSTSLPTLPDAASQGRVCSVFNTNSKGCDWSEEAKVVRCNGYFVYQLPEPPGCSMAYALEEDTISVVHRSSLTQP